MTRYAYGDSTESPLTSNFLEFLSEALAFAAHVHASEERLLAEKAKFEQTKLDGNATRDQLRQLAAATTSATNDFAAQSSEARVKKCGGAMAKRVAEAVSEEIASLDAAIEAARASLAAFSAGERRGGRDALGKMLLSSEPPDTKYELAFVAEGDKYQCTVHASSAWGFEWGGTLAPPDDHLLAKLAKVEAFVPSVLVSVPVFVSSFFKKEMKTKQTELAKHFITAFHKVDGVWTLSLRDFGQGPEAKTTGYDIAFGAGGGIFATWVGEMQAPVEELGEEDAAKLKALRSAVEAAVVELAQSGKDAATVRFDGKAFEEVEDQVKAASMLVTKMTPIVREITKHCLTPNELVLRRLLGKDRREEIFVTKASLIAKLMPLPSSRRALFSGLELGDLALDVNAEKSGSDKASTEKEVSSVPPALATPSVAAAPPAIVETPATPSVSVPPEATLLASVPPESGSEGSNGTKLTDSGRPQASGEFAVKRETSALGKAMKKIVGLAKEGKSDAAFKGYAELFRDETFLVAKVEDQRQALRIMVKGKHPAPNDAVRAAFKSASDALSDMVKQWNDPSDLELLALCQTALDEKEAASATFKAAAAIEAERDPASPRIETWEKRAQGT